MRPRKVDTRVVAMRSDAGRKQRWLGPKVTARGETGENCHVLSRGGYYRATVLPCSERERHAAAVVVGCVYQPRTGLGRFRSLSQLQDVPTCKYDVKQSAHSP